MKLTLANLAEHTVTKKVNQLRQNYFYLFEAMRIKLNIRSIGYAKKLIHASKVYVNDEIETNEYREVHLNKDKIYIRY